MKPILLCLCLIGFQILGITQLASAQDATQPAKEGILSRLLSPGPLIEGHKDLEQVSCLKCHDAGAGVPDKMCLDCHKEIKTHVEQKIGYHGKVSAQACIKCHSDHKGRKFDSTDIDPKQFDHDLTGYPLTGGHAKLECTECHKQKRTEKPIRPNDTRWFGLENSCVSCHKKDDIHFFKSQKFAEKDCNACHSIDKWKDVPENKFNHTRDAKYTHEGKHADLKCNKCHEKDKNEKFAKYEWPDLKQKQCLSCHEDVHKQNLSPKFQNGRCTDCHTQNAWKIKRFDHAKVTKWPLEGEHGRIDCTKCHKQTVPLNKDTSNYKWVGLDTKCLSCHKDQHLYGNHKARDFKNLNDCTACHKFDGWKEANKFNHNINTTFKIRGKHKEVKCEECHVKQTSGGRTLNVRKYHWQELKAKTCNTCHENPHTKTFSKEFLKKACTECHTEEGWNRKKSDAKFDHDADTRFPLKGRHLKLKCAECHKSGKNQVFKFKGFDKNFCVTCHGNVHKDQFSPKFSNQACNECHNNDSFKKNIKFDHDKTNFPLRQKHAEAKCQECHVPTNKKLPTKPPVVANQFKFPDLTKKNCATCHTDYHKQQLGNDCLKCHTETSWTHTTFDHNKDSAFVLKGRHSSINCNECHKQVKNEFIIHEKKRLPFINYKPLDSECASCHRDPHKGNFGNRCNTCHSEKSWKESRNFHQNFTLTGIHFSLECTECHKDQRNLAGLSGSCISCHKKDDPHNNTLPNCSECHRQTFWEHQQFRHSLSNFPLRGVHRTLSCNECHSGGVYQGKSNACISCHAKDDPHAGTRPDCKACHSQFDWQSRQ